MLADGILDTAGRITSLDLGEVDFVDAAGNRCSRNAPAGRAAGRGHTLIQALVEEGIAGRAVLRLRTTGWQSHVSLFRDRSGDR